MACEFRRLTDKDAAMAMKLNTVFRENIAEEKPLNEFEVTPKS